MSSRVKTVLLVTLIIPACRDRSGETTLERADVDGILNHMSEKLKSATALTFSTTETNERIRRNDERVTLHIDRQVAILI
jgi:hypothetical protein